MKPVYLLCFLMGSIQPVFSQAINIYERPVQSAPSHNFDVLHYRIELTFEGENRAFEGETTITLRALSDNFKSIELHAETYQVRAVTSAQQKALAFEHDKGQLNIQLSEALGYNDTLSILIKYGSSRFEVNPEDYGMGHNYPLGIGFFEATEEHPFVFNAYSFPTGARHWFPGYDHPIDRATHETIITTLGNHKVLANGILQSVRSNDNGTVTYHWSQKQAHPTYLYNFVSGPYEVLEDEYKGKPVNYWVYPQDTGRALRSFHRTPEILAFFEDYYGVNYPWDKYDQICVPGIGGGAEATTATLIGASTLHDEKAEKDFPSHWLVAHEAAHHWWGDFVSYRDWTQTWLSESFATFSEYLYSNHLYGAEEGALNLYDKRTAYLTEAKDNYQRPIAFNQWAYPNQNFDRHTYQKGALVLHMLRDYLGEDNFRRVLKHFLSTHAYQPVDTHDFMKSIWEVTGLNLDWFFDQWILGAGHPVLDIAYEWKNKELILAVKQTQDTSQKVSIFKMPAKVAITTAKGTTFHTIWLTEASQAFPFPCDDQPLMVRFDPDQVLLKEWTFKKTKEALLFQAKKDTVMGRLWAVQQLSAHLDDPKVLDFLKKCVQEDPFWAVRREALQTLAKAEQAISPILENALQDRHSRVRAAALNALGDLRQDQWHATFKKVYETDSSYVVQAEAVRALGKLKKAQDKPFFDQVSQEKSPRDILKQAANWSLMQMK
ncbi:MAG: M1 family metallopeptidase [Saprospiraceae bacterium]